MNYTWESETVSLCLRRRSGIPAMPKSLCILGMVVAVLLLIVFGLDLAIGFPFGRMSTVTSVGFLVCAVILGFLSWSTMREQT